MLKMKKAKSTKLEVSRKMPPLFHTLPGRKFDITKSEVIKWLVSQPDILQYLFDKISHVYLEYDPKTGKWRGADRD